MSKVFESGGHKMPPSLYVAPVGPPVAPVRAVSALPEPPGLDTTPSNARTPPVRGGGANFNAKGKNAQVPTTAEENDAGEDWDDLSNFETPPKTPWRSSHAIGGLQASAVKGPPSPTSSLASFTPSSRSTSKRPFGTNGEIRPQRCPCLFPASSIPRLFLHSVLSSQRVSILCKWNYVSTPDSFHVVRVRNGSSCTVGTRNTSRKGISQSFTCRDRRSTCCYTHQTPFIVHSTRNCTQRN